MSDIASVLFVNEAFYDAFRARDLSTMDAIWSQRQEVACIHPGWPPLAGREEVLRSWQGILGGSGSPEILCREPKAFVICYEQIGRNILVATNIFAREGHDWRLIHHQAGPCNAVTAEDELDDELGDEDAG
jgi:ketosteroid isomerase-like protein